MTRKIAFILCLMCVVFFPWQHAVGQEGFITGIAEGVVNAVLGPTGYLLLQVSSFVLWLTGVLLNFAIGISVVNFKGFIERVDVIEAAWLAIRDVLNIFFVIALLKAGFDKILGDDGSVVKIIKNLVIAAIGINFSILIATTCIDVSNAFALHYYRYIIGDTTSTVTLSGGVTAKVMDSLGVTTLFNLGGKGVGDAADALVSASPLGSLFTGKGFAYFLFASIMVLMVAFTFAVACVMFIYRAIAFVILLITAPFAFAGYIMPEFKKNQDEWWGTLRKECMWPPLYFIALYVGLQIIQSPQFKTFTNTGGGANDLSFVGILTGDEKAIAAIFNFVVVLVILNGALMVAKTYGPRGLDSGQKFGSWLVKGAAGTALTGGAKATKYFYNKDIKGYGLGKTVEGTLRGASRLLDTKYTPNLSNTLSRFADFQKNASWDVRNIPLAPTDASVFGTVGAGVNFGKPGEAFGFKAKTEEEKKKERLENKKNYYKNMEFKDDPKLKAELETDKYTDADGNIKTGGLKGKLQDAQDAYNKAIAEKASAEVVTEKEQELDAARYAYDEKAQAIKKAKDKQRMIAIQQNETDPEEGGALLKHFRDGDDKDKEKIAILNIRIKNALKNETALREIILGAPAKTGPDGKVIKKKPALKKEEIQKIDPEQLIKDEVLKHLNLEQVRAMKDVLDANDQQTVVAYFKNDTKKGDPAVKNFFKGLDKGGNFNKDVANKANEWEGSNLATSYDEDTKKKTSPGGAAPFSTAS